VVSWRDTLEKDYWYDISYLKPDWLKNDPQKIRLLQTDIRERTPRHQQFFFQFFSPKIWVYFQQLMHFRFCLFERKTNRHFFIHPSFHIREKNGLKHNREIIRNPFMGRLTRIIWTWMNAKMRKRHSEREREPRRKSERRREINQTWIAKGMQRAVNDMPLT